MNEHKRKRGKRVSHNARLFRHPKDKQPLTLRFTESDTGLSISERLAESWWELPILVLKIGRAPVVLNLIPVRGIDGSISCAMHLEHDGFYIQCDVVWSETEEGTTVSVEVLLDLPREECIRRLTDFQQVVDNMIDEHEEILRAARTCSATLALHSDRLSVER